ncbi:hypothetical protein CUMW_033900 [Citrus unshiu]|nr:hypothetical protein CUMW_033900 [Citrus unshiu]
MIVITTILQWMRMGIRCCRDGRVELSMLPMLGTFIGLLKEGNLAGHMVNPLLLTLSCLEPQAKKYKKEKC